MSSHFWWGPVSLALMYASLQVYSSVAITKKLTPPIAPFYLNSWAYLIIFVIFLFLEIYFAEKQTNG